MLTIHKYPLMIHDVVVVNMPMGSLITKVECQAGQAMIWALVNTDAPLAYRTFQVFGTGNEIAPLKNQEGWDSMFATDGLLEFVATFQDPPMVWHVFERVPTPTPGAFQQIFSGPPQLGPVA
jgi:hypothetical protein